MLKDRRKGLSGAGRHEVPSEATDKINMSFDAQSIDLEEAKARMTIRAVVHVENSIFDFPGMIILHVKAKRFEQY